MNDELVSIAHLLLNELEYMASNLSVTPNHDEEDLRDAEAVIERAKEVLSKYPI